MKTIKKLLRTLDRKFSKKLRIFFKKFRTFLENLEKFLENLENLEEFRKINSLIVLNKTLLFKLFKLLFWRNSKLYCKIKTIFVWLEVQIMDKLKLSF